MVRKTSIEAYRQITDNGLLSRRRLEVYRALFKHGPGTSAEIIDRAGMNQNNKAPNQSRARFTELREWGVALEVGVRECTITGKKAIVWDVTPYLPVKPPSKKPKKQEILAKIKKLGQRLQDPYRSELREIYHLIEK